MVYGLLLVLLSRDLYINRFFRLIKVAIDLTCFIRCFILGQEIFHVLGFFCQGPISDLQDASRSLTQALQIRDRYMDMSMQSFPGTAGRFLCNLNGTSASRFDVPCSDSVPKESLGFYCDSGAVSPLSEKN